MAGNVNYQGRVVVMAICDHYGDFRLLRIQGIWELEVMEHRHYKACEVAGAVERISHETGLPAFYRHCSKGTSEMEE